MNSKDVIQMSVLALLITYTVTLFCVNVSATIDVDLILSDKGFVSYDHFKAELQIYKSDPDATEVMVFGILEIAGSFYYWPEFGPTVAYETMEIESGLNIVTLLDFDFPDIYDAVPFGPIAFWGAWYQDPENYGFDQEEFWLGDEYKWTPTPVPTSVPIMLSEIPAGSFDRGSLPGEMCRDNNEGPVKTITLTIPFLIQKTEVTQMQWVLVFGSNPSAFEGANRPVENVSWFDACIFCNRLSIEEGLTPCYYRNEGLSQVFTGTPPVTSGNVFWKEDVNGYRLPTEAEWEYACRAGTTSPYNNGMELLSCYQVDENLDPIAWYRQNAGDMTHDVGLKQPSLWDLYDMHGNVDEWCWDWWGKVYYQTGSTTDPSGPETGMERVLRGGSWMIYPAGNRSADRGFYTPGVRRNIMGFRIARTQFNKAA
ncbi:formylglycine-generating enzyme family protein [bacterium]|nr:formylglycine-generating enzyme family protein [bacterium]